MHGEKRLLVKLFDGTRTQSQKRLVLANLKEIYKMFKEMHSTKKFGFSKFYNMRSKNYNWLGKVALCSLCLHFSPEWEANAECTGNK